METVRLLSLNGAKMKLILVLKRIILSGMQSLDLSMEKDSQLSSR